MSNTAINTAAYNTQAGLGSPVGRRRDRRPGGQSRPRHPNVHPQPDPHAVLRPSHRRLRCRRPGRSRLPTPIPTPAPVIGACADTAADPDAGAHPAAGPAAASRRPSRRRTQTPRSPKKPTPSKHAVSRPRSSGQARHSRLAEDSSDRPVTEAGTMAIRHRVDGPVIARTSARSLLDLLQSIVKLQVRCRPGAWMRLDGEDRLGRRDDELTGIGTVVRGGAMSRRAFLQVGYSGLLGLGLPGLLAARRARRRPAAKPGRARSVIVILLERRARAARLVRHEARGARRHPRRVQADRHGGARHPDLRAPARPGGAGRSAGDRPVDGASRGEPPGGRPPRADGPPVEPARGQRPRPGRLARRLPVLRGRARPAPSPRATASPMAWPCRCGWSRARSPGRARTPASSARGTTPGSSGSTRIGPTSRDDSLALPTGLDPDRLHRRRHLLGQTAVPPPGDAFVDQQDAALAMLCNGQVGRALDLDREDPRLVDRYGRPPLRPVAPDRPAGWSRPACRSCRRRWGSSRPGTPTSPTSPGCKNDLLPPLDRAVSALLDDLDARGLLDETLVVMLGEFGRTPRISAADAGRRPRPRPLAERLPGRLRRRRGRRRARSSASPTGSGPIPSPAPSALPTWPRRSTRRSASTRRPSSATASAARSGSARAR